MAIFRYTASADTTITNAFEANMVTRGTGSNMGYADSLAVFSIYGQESGSNGQSPDATAAWDQFSRNAKGFPIIRLLAVPGSGGTALHIRYRRNNVMLQNFPDEFGYVIALGVLGWVNPIMRRAFERQLKKIIKNHRKGGKDVQIVSINPHMVQTNNTVSGLYEAG